MTPPRPTPRRPIRARWVAAAALSAVAVVALASCGSPVPPRIVTRPPATSQPEVKQTFTLTSADLDALKKQAASGSGAAAYRLALYYETVRHDQPEAQRWMKTAAENGDLGGMYGYATYLRESNDPADHVMARYWLQQVLAKGDAVSKSVAQRDLRELDAAQKAGQ